MTQASVSLEGRALWLTATSAAAAGFGALLAAAYLCAALDFGSGRVSALVMVLLPLSVASILSAQIVIHSRLAMLRAIGRGAAPSTPSNLEAAAREVADAPNILFGAATGCSAAASIATALIWGLVSEVSTLSMFRAGLMGCLFAPLSAMLGTLVLQTRARRLLMVIVDGGLSPEQLYAALPPVFGLRSRALVYSAIAAITPMALVIDLSLHRLRTLVALAATAEPTAAAALFLDERQTGFLPLVMAAGVIILAVTACAWLAGSSLASPLRELAMEAERLASGRYGRPKLVPSELEVWAVARSLAMLERRLVDVLTQLEETTLGISKTTASLVAGGRQQTQSITGQAAALTATSSTTGELARTAREIAESTAHVASMAQQTLDEAKTGNASAEAFARAMQQVKIANQTIATSVERLNKRVQQVGKVVEFIDSIADKSDLLALNAELEGNKAGEVGRGFSLVAAEMRRLAESVMSSTREIVQLISEIRDSTNAAVMATEAGVKATEPGFELAQDVRDGLLQIVTFANKSSDALSDISLAASEQRAGTDQLAAAMTRILSSTAAGAETSRRMTATNESLSRLAKELDGSLLALQGKS